jgi:hypothetical protein
MQRLVQLAVERDGVSRQLTRLEECRATVVEHKAVQQSRLVSRLSSNLQQALAQVDEQRCARCGALPRTAAPAAAAPSSRRPAARHGPPRRLALQDYKEQLEQAYCQQQELAQGDASLQPDEALWARCSARCEQLLAQPPRLQELSAQALASSIVPPDVARVRGGCAFAAARRLLPALEAALLPPWGPRGGGRAASQAEELQQLRQEVQQLRDQLELGRSSQGQLSRLLQVRGALGPCSALHAQPRAARAPLRPPAGAGHARPGFPCFDCTAVPPCRTRTHWCSSCSS